MFIQIKFLLIKYKHFIFLINSIFIPQILTDTRYYSDIYMENISCELRINKLFSLEKD